MSLVLLDRPEHIKRVESYALQESDISLFSTSGTNNDYIGTIEFTDNKTWNNTVEGKVLIANKQEVSSTNRDLVESQNGFTPYSGALSSKQRIWFIVAKGTYANLAEAQADLAGTVIQYELAEPVTTYEDYLTYFDVERTIPIDVDTPVNCDKFGTLFGYRGL